MSQETTTISEDSTTTENSKEDTTTNSPSSSGECESEGFFPDQEDCQKYYRCENDGNGGFRKHDFICGEGTAWDENAQTCNHRNQVARCNGGKIKIT
jgi:hypothetical protein